MKKLVILILFVLAFTAQDIYSQDTNSVVTRAIVINGDTLPVLALEEVKIFGPVVFASKYEALRFSKLVYHVKKVYPYAKIVTVKVQEFNYLISKADSKREKKRLMKQAEDELKAQFEDDVKNMTSTQGEILIKLIDRETGSSSFDIIKEFRGGIVATFYQTFGRFFGYNLKSTYDPFGADKDIEQIMVMIENGEL
ncbi:MAG TPA: DUF4294 domain-containing protein [Bacteroidales bacterium]|jgi:hypothetical protein|nr:DUF4294 domain-containing protein [Bacteroidales bacterium]HNZ43707.1 DUF4294 domain-containing protein [Bacteroidales bacterium]HOH84285.1 DUF4294 domain-containing protein [Bacteroidales bacterium]HPB25355.1 DUF4294 domain-containing protein [Bacteroidales bacterium]HPI30116.1 DUF4294 domain-containing protein [Bacteroidales bacterium]